MKKLKVTMAILIFVVTIILLMLSKPVPTAEQRLDKIELEIKQIEITLNESDSIINKVK